MIRAMRDKFGPVTITILVGGIALVFIFFGFYSPRDPGTGSDAGSVNGEPISASLFQKEYDRRLEFFRSMSGGKLTSDQIRMYRVAEGLFNELATRKLLVQEAEKNGFFPSPEEVRRKIVEIPAFQKEKRFDKIQYKQVLQANQWTPTEFEKMVRDDLISESWKRYFKDLSQPSSTEIDFEVRISKDQRVIEYVYFAPSGQAAITPDDVQKFLAHKDKMDLVRSKYDSAKESEYKGKKFEEVSDTIARELITAQRSRDQLGQLEKSAQEMKSMFGGATAKLEAAAKKAGGKFTRSAPMSRKSNYLPGVGESKELIDDAFSTPNGSPPKIYRLAGGILVARAVPAPKDPKAQSEEELRKSVAERLSNQKMSALFTEWEKKLRDSAKIKMSSWVKNMGEG